MKRKPFATAGMLLLLTVLPASTPMTSRAQQPTTDAQDARMNRFLDSLLAQMTVEEKLGQLTQYTGQWAATGPSVPQGGEDEIRKGRVGSFLNLFGADVTRETQRLAVEESRLGIPLLFGHDVIHGFRTIFPIPLAGAATWNPEAIQHAAHIAAVEATAHGIHWTFAPMVDLARDPRWGRILEGAGEDPYLNAVMAAAQVQGFQGDDLRAANTLLACAKHFVAYGGAEGGRDYNVVDISERTLREIYLPPFKAAVDAGVETFMASFNEIAGVPMHAHEALIDGVLRGEWGFEGMMVSDYTGVLELIQHGVAANRADAGRLSLRAGVDMDMVSGIYITDLLEPARAGTVPMNEIDAAARRVLRAKYRLGLFDDPYRYSDPARQEAMTLTAEHRAFAREVARQSLVLLKNENGTLPLAKNPGTVAVIGPLADAARSSLGGWAAAGRGEDAVTVLAGIREAVAPETTVLYAKGSDVTGDDRSGFAEAVQRAREADVVVLVLGEHEEMSSEANSRSSISLPAVQQALAEAVHATGTPVVAVLLNGRPLALPWLDENVPAILEAWFPGVEAGHAVADVLFGDVNPSGKLPTSFPRTVGQVPTYYNHKNTGRPPDPNSKWTSKYIDVPWTPLYPFGHGLSYSKFAYTNLEVSPGKVGLEDDIRVSVGVRNEGDRAGDEVVQLYIRDEVGSVTRPVKELRGFERITLQPGEAKTVTFTLTPDDLAMYNLAMQHVVEPGFFTVFVGTSSQDVLEARFEVTAR